MSMLILALVAGLAARPVAAVRWVDVALVEAWRVLGDVLVERELGALAQQIERERQDIRDLEVLRDDLEARLGRLGTRSDRVSLPELRPTLDHAGRILAEARDWIHQHEADVMALEAAASARRVDRALAAMDDPAASWTVQVLRARELLRTPAPRSESVNGTGH
jgi:hypothetical protein